MQEQVVLKKYRTGTTVTFFDTMITEDNFPTPSEPSVLFLDNFDNPIKLLTNYTENDKLSSGIEIWSIEDGANINKLQNAPYSGRILSGRSFSQITERTGASLQAISTRFKSTTNQLFSGQSKSFVLTNKKLLDDMDITVKLERSHDVLNTLSTYNKVYNEFPKRESNTGVVFGKLEAVQKIKDEEGNFIRIPLRGVPIGVFNPGEKFGNITDTDQNGDRIRMNFKVVQGESNVFPNKDFYPNDESYEFDYNRNLPDRDEYLRIDENSDIIKNLEEFKYSVLTNENGEFIIHDIPVGPQILMFEVDLLQQGLTMEEVALNFFPYRGENISSVDEVPHFFFRKIPIDVLPSWGDFQTGYTEVNINVNLDLRKWATYFFPPICAKMAYQAPKFFNDDGTLILDENEGDYVSGQQYDVFVKLGDPYLYKFNPTPASIEIRDMAKLDVLNPESSTNSIQAVLINDILQRKNNLVNSYSWVGEFSQIINKVEIRNFGYNAIKLPANMYDPNGYKTNYMAEPIINMYQKGVWLCGYQFKLYHLNKNEAYRTTGFYTLNYENNSSRDNFHLNTNYPPIDDASIGELNDISSKQFGKSLGTSIFGKAWSVNYPEKYSIPKPPSDGNTQDISESYDKEVMEFPVYKTGHLVGTNLKKESTYGSVLTSGFALSKFKVEDEDDVFYSNSFCYSISNSSLYAYEYAPWKDYGMYSNGYLQGEKVGEDNYSSFVLNGEKYQRVEAGYGYYMHPYGFPRVGYNTEEKIDYICRTDNDIALQGFIVVFPSSINNNDPDFYFKKYYSNYFIPFNNGLINALRLDYDKRENNKVDRNQGALSIYRIINPGVENSENIYDLIESVQLKKYKIKIKIPLVRIQNAKASNYSKFVNSNNDDQYWKPWEKHDSDITKSSGVLQIKNNGNVQVTVKVGTISKTITAGNEENFNVTETRRWDESGFEIELESNSNISENDNGEWGYQNFKYNIWFKNIVIPNKRSQPNGDWEFNNDNNFGKYGKELNLGEAYERDGSTYYVFSCYNNVKVRKGCNQSNSNFNKKNITIDGLYFFRSKSSVLKIFLTTYSSIGAYCVGNEKALCNLYEGYHVE